MGQRSSQLPEPSRFSRSDPGRVVMSEVMDSKGNRPLIQYLTHPDEQPLHANTDSVEESEAVRLLAARVPPELFENILFYVNVNRISQRTWSRGQDLKRHRGEPSTDDILPDLKQCSLVCLFWANRCRQHMFRDRTLFIRSYEDAKIFRGYVVGGCPKLTPVHQLIKRIYVIQNYSGIRASQGSERHTSFLHLLYLPSIQDKLEEFSINGPVPDGFNPAKLDTPHWGVPPHIVVPSSFLQENTSLADVHFPYFYHIIKYIKHFSHATLISFNTITWNEQMAVALPYASSTSTIACQRRPRSLRIWARGACTNSVHLALTAVMLNPNCPLHRLSGEELVWMMKFMTLLWGDKIDPSVIIGFDVSEQATTMDLYPFHFVFEETSAYTDRSASALSVVGMHAYINKYVNDLAANFDALVNHARTQPTIRALVLLFDSFERLQGSLKPFVEALTLATETIELVLAYEKKEERKVVGVDLVNLEPNDRIWEELRGRFGHNKSLEMLQRELNKKKWMSVH